MESSVEKKMTKAKWEKVLENLRISKKEERLFSILVAYRRRCLVSAEKKP
jgi:hypothetical protein